MEHPRVVLRKGHIGVSFYFIFSGSVFVNVEELLTKTGHVMWHTAITLNRGDSFGVMTSYFLVAVTFQNENPCVCMSHDVYVCVSRAYVVLRARVMSRVYVAS